MSVMETSLRWKGGKYINDSGYVMIYKPTHPHASSNGYIREHRFVMEQSLNRYLEPKEFVHHLNRNKTDNRLENLILFSSRVDHQKFHYPKGSKFGASA